MARPSLALTFSSAAYIVTGYVVTVGLARVLHPDGFGTYSVVTAILTLVNLLVARGVPVAATRRIARDSTTVTATMRSAWRATAIVAAAAVVVVCASADPLARLLDEELRTLLVIGSMAGLTYAVEAMAVAPLNGLRRFGWQAAERTLYALIRVLLILLGAHVAGIAGAVAGFVLSPLVAALPTLWAPGRGGDAPQSQHAGPAARVLLREAAPLIMTSIWISLLLTIDLLALRGVSSAFDTGLYGAAGTLAHVPFFLMSMLPTEVLPRVAAEPDQHQRRSLATKLLDDTVLLLATPTILLLTIGPRVMELIFGASYGDGIQLVPPLTAATAAVTVYGVLVAVDGAHHQLRHAVVLGAVGAVTLSIAVALVGSTVGVQAAAHAAALVTIALAAGHWIITSRAGRASSPSAGSGLIVATWLGLLLFHAITPGSMWLEAAGLVMSVPALVFTARLLLPGRTSADALEHALDER